MRNLSLVVLLSAVLAAAPSAGAAPTVSPPSDPHLASLIADHWTAILTLPMDQTPYGGGDACVPLSRASDCAVGGPLLDGHSATTEYLRAWLPDDNVLGAPAQEIRFGSFGYGVLLPPLPPARHAIRIEQEGQAPNPDPVPGAFYINVNVQAGRKRAQSTIAAVVVPRGRARRAEVPPRVGLSADTP
jgi:hypothetical protein